jgi:hypothetical protein
MWSLKISHPANPLTIHKAAMLAETGMAQPYLIPVRLRTALPRALFLPFPPAKLALLGSDSRVLSVNFPCTPPKFFPCAQKISSFARYLRLFNKPQRFAEFSIVVPAPGRVSLALVIVAPIVRFCLRPDQRKYAHQRREDRPPLQGQYPRPLCGTPKRYYRRTSFSVSP